MALNCKSRTSSVNQKGELINDNNSIYMQREEQCRQKGYKVPAVIKCIKSLR